MARNLLLPFEQGLLPLLVGNSYYCHPSFRVVGDGCSNVQLLTRMNTLNSFALNLLTVGSPAARLYQLPRCVAFRNRQTGFKSSRNLHLAMDIIIFN
jgi:hypothetical protein